MSGNDGLGSSSFTTGVNWAGGQAPTAGNNYFTAGFFMRSPGDGVTAYTFAGDSLTFGPANLSGGVNGSMLEKFTGAAGASRTLTINNLTNTAGAMLRSGGTAGALIHLAGNHFTIAGSSIMQADQCIWVVDMPLIGGDSVILTNFANNANDHNAYTADNSQFTGSWYLTGAGTTAWSLELGGANCLPGNPSTFNPGQITFLGTGQLRDTFGCAYTNSNGGITLAANATINTSVTTLLGVPITDITNGVPSVATLTSSGAGTLILSNKNSYSGATIISAGVLTMGVDNAITNNGNVTDNAQLDLNGHKLTINVLTGSGSVDTLSGGSATLTVGSADGSGTLSGAMQNSAGTLSLNKVGSGTLTLSGGYSHSGQTLVSGGTLAVVTTGALPGTPGDLVVSNGALVTINAANGTALPVAGLVVQTNSSLTLTANGTFTGINATSLTLQDNSTTAVNYGTVVGNPTTAAINVAGGVNIAGTNVVLAVSANGLATGTFPFIKYTGTPLSSIANLVLNPPPGVVANLVNNTGNDSIDIQITQVPNQLAWNGANGTAWDLGTVNWTNTISGGLTVFRQYTNGLVIAGDAVTFDDTLFNDNINPQPTNIVLNSRFFAFPVFFNNTLPYTIAGSGGLVGVTSLVKSNTGSLTLLTSNSYSGGVNIAGGALIITNDSALGTAGTALTLNGSTLQVNGITTNSRAIAIPAVATIGVGAGATLGLGGQISGAAASLNKTDNGTLVLAARETFTGNLFLHAGTTILDQGGSITNTVYHDVGQNGNDSATFTLRGNAGFSTTSDFNVGDLDNSSGVLNIQNSATLTANAIFIGSANASGSTASGVVNQSGGTVNELSTAVGTFSIGGRTSASGVGVYNISGGTINAAAGIRVGGTGIGTFNINGGTVNARGGLNIARIAGSFGTNNLNGGLLLAFNIASSTSSNAVFNFNGGTVRADFTPGSPWFQAGIQANVLAGGAVIDSSNNTIVVNAPLLAGSANGGLTKLGTGTLTLNGTNTFTGPVTNNAGTLSLAAPSTYSGKLQVNAGNVQITTRSTLPGGAAVNSGSTFTVTQSGVAGEAIGALTFNGAASGSGAILALVPTNTSSPLVTCSTLTLNGTNTISLPIQTVGTIPVIQYTSIAGSGNITNLSLPQGATGYISNSAANLTIYAVITGSGPGIVWTGTNSLAGKTNFWDINTTTNWLVGIVPTTYRQVVVPGDVVSFTDTGSGTVLLTNSVGPTSLTISNNTRNYTFSGPGNITGSTGIQKAGTGTATINLSGNNYSGSTTVSNGTLQVGSATAVSSGANLVIGPNGTFEMAGNNVSVSDLSGSGILDNNSGLDVLLTLNNASSGTWAGSIQDQGHGTALIRNGGGTWVVSGVNRLNNASPASQTNEFNGGTVIITNGGAILTRTLIAAIPYGGGSATMVVDGGTLGVSNNILAVGYGGTANGTLILNNGLIVHTGGAGGPFGGGNQVIVGALGATGTLIVNGGQLRNSQPLFLGQNAGANGTLQLNGGVVEATQFASAGTPASSIAYLNGGALLAFTNSGDFVNASTTPLVQSNGFILDDGGFVVTMSSQGFQEDASFPGGGMTKRGPGTLYLDSSSSYNGLTVVTNGTLAGVGSVNGSMLVVNTGNLGAGNAGGIGQFYINNNLDLQASASFRIDKTGSNPTHDQINVGGNVQYGGVLVITNTTSDATPLANGDTFQLFSVSGTPTGNFTTIVGSPGAGLAYTFTPANGTLNVITQTIAPNPTNITFSVTGNTLSLNWPSDHLGWFLQAQTNNLATGLSGNWFDIPGSDSSTSATITINSNEPSVYYRLRHP